MLINDPIVRGHGVHILEALTINFPIHTHDTMVDFCVRGWGQGAPCATLKETSPKEITRHNSLFPFAGNFIMGDYFMKVTTLRINIGTPDGDFMPRITRDAKMSSHVFVLVDYVQCEISNRAININ